MPSGVIFSESFGWASTAANLTAAGINKWTATAGGSGFSVGTGFGRGGGKGLQIQSGTTQQGTIEKAFTTQYTELTLGIAVNFISAGAAYNLFSFVDGGTIQVDVRIQADGSLIVTRNGTTILGPSTILFAPNSGFHYFWLRALIHPSAGTIKVIGDGAEVLSGTGLNTRATASSQINMLRLGNLSSLTKDVRYADIVVIDCAVNPVDKLSNDVRVQYLGPDADGFYNTDWAPNTGASRFGAIDEIPPNSDTDYIEEANVNGVVSVGLTDVAAVSGTIHTVVPYHVSRKTDAGSGSVQPGIREGGVDAYGTNQPLLVSYGHYMGGTIDSAPSGGVWDYTKLAAAELLLKRTA